MFSKRPYRSQDQIILILLCNLLFFLNSPYLVYGSPAQITINGNAQSSFSFNQVDGNEFIINNPSHQQTIEISVNLQSSSQNEFSDSCYLLIISGQQISDMDFTTIDVADMTLTIIKYQQQYNYYNMDLDGFSTCQKKLSALADMTSSTPSTTLYAYLLGPYKFGAPTPKRIPQSGPPASIAGTYRVQSQRSCLNSCNSPSNGSCLLNTASQYYCECKDGYVNRDCSIEATQFTINKDSLQLDIGTNERVYFYIDFSQSANQVKDDLTISFQTATSNEIMLFSTTAEQYGYYLMLPDYTYWLEERGLNYGNSIGNQKKYLLISKESAQKLINSNTQLIFLAVGGSLFGTRLSIQAQTASTSSSMDSGMLILYIVIGTLAFLVLLYIVFIIVRTKRLRRLQENLAMLQQQNGQGRVHSQENNGVMVVVVGMNPNGVGVPRVQRAQAVHLTLKQIDEYMPAKKLDENMKQAYNADQCAVCLEEFLINKDLIRMTICQHLFHDECLQSWLKKQLNCPFCRQELTLDKLKDFKANPHMYQHIVQIQTKEYLAKSINIPNPLGSPIVPLIQQQIQPNPNPEGVGLIPIAAIPPVLDQPALGQPENNNDNNQFVHSNAHSPKLDDGSNPEENGLKRGSNTNLQQKDQAPQSSDRGINSSLPQISNNPNNKKSQQNKKFDRQNSNQKK